MSIIEKFPECISVKDQVLFAGKSDVDHQGHFQEQWLVITKDHLLVFDSSGKSLQKIEVKSLTESTIKSFVGGGSLTVKNAEGMRVIVRFTPALMKKFVFANKLIEALIKKEALPVLSREDQIRDCDKCHHPLPEGTDV